MGEIVSVKRKRRHTFVLGLGDDDTYLIEDSTIEREPDRDTSHAPPEKPPDEHGQQGK
jgi:hypothetical protein